LIGDAEFLETFGEPMARSLDLETWTPGEDLAELYGQLEEQVQAATAEEEPARANIRANILPRIAARRNELPDAGVYRATVDDIAYVHRALLFNGGVEACDGTSVTHDSLTLTITQIGVCLVSYHGGSGSWVHRMFRRDLRGAISDPAEQALELVERRQRRGGIDQSDRTGRLSDLARTGVMTYAERAALLERSTAPWRMGHGNPVAYELMTGSGSKELMHAGLDLLARLIGEHRKFVFVPSAAERGLLTIGHALRPLEFVIFDTMTDRLQTVVDGGHYATEERNLARDFVAAFGPKIALGIYRASLVGPPQIFYAHADYAYEAALIALADSTLQEHRAFPMLLDLADTVCRTTFGTGDFRASVHVAYADAGQPFRYLGERETRR
jgi:hypothetical protein